MARIDSKLEASEERVQIPRLGMSKAMALLKSAERYEYGSDGCAISWRKPEEESVVSDGGREAVYRADSCNCQARITSRHSYAMVLTGD